MSPAETWLRGRLSAAPEALLREMVGALPAGTPAVPDALATAALSLYGRVAHGSGDREAALPLLAADALFTHAFEAQAESAPEDIPRLVERLRARLGEVVP